MAHEIYFTIQDELVRALEAPNKLPARFTISIEEADFKAMLAEGLVHAETKQPVDPTVAGIQMTIGSRLIEVVREPTIDALKEIQDKTLH